MHSHTALTGCASLLLLQSVLDGGPRPGGRLLPRLVQLLSRPGKWTFSTVESLTKLCADTPGAAEAACPPAAAALDATYGCARLP